MVEFIELLQTKGRILDWGTFQKSTLQVAISS